MAAIKESWEVWPQHMVEEPLEPELPIIDSHHHIRDPIGGMRYLVPEFLEDISTGHNIIATIAVEENAMYRQDGPHQFAPVGETEFLNGVAAMFASGRYGPRQACAGIVGAVDMMGDKVEEVLDAHIAAGGGRFRGVRARCAWLEDYHPQRWRRNFFQASPHMLANPDFRRGADCLDKLNLSLDVHIYHTQLQELIDFARTFANLTIVLNHYGVPMGVGPFAGKQAEVFAYWRTRLAELAKCSNVFLKMGGMKWVDLNYGSASPSSTAMAKAWHPYIETCTEFFGPNRCMCESNFPPEKEFHSYVVLWNAFKRATASYSAPERAALFKDTACVAYRLPQFLDATGNAGVKR